MAFCGRCHNSLVRALLLACFASCAASASVPGCSLENQTGPLPVIHFAGTLEIPSDLALLYGPGRQEITILAEYGSAGTLDCTTPLSGFSLYWPFAVDALTHSARKTPATDSRRVVVVFESPVKGESHLPARGLLSRCNQHQSVIELLANARVLLERSSLNNTEAARLCYVLASTAAPESVAAVYGLAVAEQRLRHTEAALVAFARTATLRSDFYEARSAAALLLEKTGRNGDSEAALQQLLKEKLPPPVQADVYNRLTYFYDRQEKRKDALNAKRLLVQTRTQIQTAYPRRFSDAFLAFDHGDLALRFEEQKNFADAAESYRTAARLGNDFGLSFRFEAEMGLARTLRQLGSAAQAQSICGAWHIQLRELGSELENFHWQGRELTRAKWELSCGDLDRGLRTLIEVANKYSRQSGGDPYRPAAPYRVLEIIYRARGDSQHARVYRTMADQIQTTSSNHALQQVYPDMPPPLPLQGLPPSH